MTAESVGVGGSLGRVAILFAQLRACFQNCKIGDAIKQRENLPSLTEFSELQQRMNK